MKISNLLTTTTYDHLVFERPSTGVNYKTPLAKPAVSEISTETYLTDGSAGETKIAISALPASGIFKIIDMRCTGDTVTFHAYYGTKLVRIATCVFWETTTDDEYTDTNVIGLIDASGFSIGDTLKFDGVLGHRYILDISSNIITLDSNISVLGNAWTYNVHTIESYYSKNGTHVLLSFSDVGPVVVTNSIQYRAAGF